MALVVVHLAAGWSYFDYSEGVYALTAREWIHGADLYGHVVAAQPPGMFLVGGALLGIHDSLDWLRLGVGLLQLTAGLLGARIVWRLTRSAWASAAAPALTLLTPWAVHEHGALTPELVAPPLILGAVLLCSRRRTVPGGAVLAAILPFVKLPFLLPAAAIVLLSADRRRALRWAVATLVAEAALTLAIFGGGVWRFSVAAQLHVGTRADAAHVLLGIWGQAAWNLAGLVVAAGVALAWRRPGADGVLLRLASGAVGALLFTVLTTVKVGTGLNVLVPIEAGLVPLALCGVVAVGREGRWWRLVAPLGVAFTLAQTISLVAAPNATRTPFIYPSSQRGAWGRIESSASMHRIVDTVRATCPVGRPYDGAPIVAMLAGRPAPDEQPDDFLTSRSSSLRSIAVARAAVSPVCPPAVPGNGDGKFAAVPAR